MLQYFKIGLLVFLYFIGCIARFLFGQINCEAKKIFVSKSAAVGSGTYVVKKRNKAPFIDTLPQNHWQTLFICL